MSSSGKAAERGQAATDALVAQILDGSSWPIVLVAEDLTLIWVNRAGCQELDTGRSFSLVDGKLTLRCNAADEKFRQFLDNCGARDRTFIHLGEECDTVLARCRVVRERGSESVYCVSFFRPSEKPEAADPPLAELFGLTATEERVVVLLGDGSSAESISDRLGVSIATVRKHISNAYVKIGVRSREELFACLRAYS